MTWNDGRVAGLRFLTVSRFIDLIAKDGSSGDLGVSVHGALAGMLSKRTILQSNGSFPCPVSKHVKARHG